MILHGARGGQGVGQGLSKRIDNQKRRITLARREIERLFDIRNR